MLKKDTCKLLENWRVKDFLGKNITKKDISLNNTNLPRIYGLPKIHKQYFPLRPVVSLIKELYSIRRQALENPPRDVIVKN